MGSSKSVKPPIPTVRWRMLLSAMKRLIEFKFPDSNSYYESQWGQWSARIDKGHMDDESSVDEFIKSESNIRKYGDDIGEIAGEELAKAEELTNNMYAALIVSLWSQIESYLKGAVRVVSIAKNRRNRALKETIKFCKDSLADKETGKATLNSCIKSLKEIDKEIPHKFGDIKDFFNKEVKMNVEDCKKYNVINAVRILNNSFKHNGGHYEPLNEKPHNIIEKMLLRKWKITNDDNSRYKIAYSELPIRNVSTDCRIFMDDLFSRLDKALNKSRRGSGNVH